MNFASYQSRGQLEAPYQHYTKPANLHVDNSGERMLARANADTAKVIVEGFNDWREQYDQGKVMEANNEYNRLMSEGTAELMQKKQENALNVVEDYDKLHAKSLEKVRKKYGQFINYGKAGQAFTIYTERDNNTRREHMMKYQMAETDAYHETQFNNQLATCIQTAADGGYTDISIDQGLNRAEGFIEARYGQYGKEMVTQQKRKFQGQIVENALTLAVNTEDYSRVEQLCAKYKDVIDPQKLPAFLGMVSKRRNEAKKITFHQQMFRDLPENATDEQVREYVANHHQPKQRAGGGNTSREEGIRIMSIAIGEQESGGDYTATNSSGALGKYQIMDYNWPYWAQDAGLPADADWRVPENQEIVFRHKVGEYIDEYGVEGAIIAWYAGAANGARWRDGEPDAIGEGGHYSWDAPQYGPEGEEYTSVRGYLESVLALRENAGNGSAADAELDLVDLQKEQDDAVKAWHNHRNEIDATNNRIIRNYGERLQDLINHGAATQEAMQNLVDQAVLESGGDNSVRTAMETKVLAEISRQQKAVEQAAKQRASEIMDDGFEDFLVHEISVGNIKSKTRIKEICNEMGITDPKQQARCMGLWDDYLDNKGLFKITKDDFDAIKAHIPELEGVKGQAKAQMVSTIRTLAYQNAKKYMAEHDGKMPEEIELADMVSKDFKEKVATGGRTMRDSFFGSWFSTSIDISRADLAANGYMSATYLDDGRYMLMKLNGVDRDYKTEEEVLAMIGSAGYGNR